MPEPARELQEDRLIRQFVLASNTSNWRKMQGQQLAHLVDCFHHGIGMIAADRIAEQRMREVGRLRSMWLPAK